MSGVLNEEKKIVFDMTEDIDSEEDITNNYNNAEFETESSSDNTEKFIEMNVSNAIPYSASIYVRKGK